MLDKLYEDFKYYNNQLDSMINADQETKIHYENIIINIENDIDKIENKV